MSESNEIAKLREALRLAERLQKKQKESAFELYKPYPKQLALLSSTNRVRVLLGGNRCLGENTVVEDAVTGERRRVKDIQEPFHVWAWDGTKRVVAEAGKPFVKGFSDVYEVTFSDGTVMEASANHLVLTSSGWHELSELLSRDGRPPQFDVSRLPSSLDIGQLVHDEDVLSFWQTALDSQWRCSEDSRPCDEQPPRPSTYDQGAQPSPVCALEHMSACVHDHTCGPLGARDNAPSRSRACQESYHQTTHDAAPLLSVPVEVGQSHASSRLYIPLSDLLQEPPPLQSRSYPRQEVLECGQDRVEAASCEASTQTGFGLPDSERPRRRSESPIPGSPGSVSDLLPRSCDEVGQRLLDTVRSRLLCVLQSYLAASLVGTNSVVQINLLRKGEIWDFSVEGLSNYFLTSESTVLHHNSGKTLTTSFEVACHATGKYPSWWRGIRFSKPPIIWVCGESVARVRDTLQSKLIGDIGRWGTGLIPKDLVLWDDIVKKPGTPHAIDIMPIKHINGIASIQFFSYDAGRDKVQGSAVDFVLMDEEPPEDFNNEIKMRILDTNGYVLYSYTPLQGVTPLYDSQTRSESSLVVHLTWDDVTHLDDEAKRQLTEGMSEDEIKARKYGIATIGTGKILQFDESDYVVNDFAVPRHWPEIGGLDIGLTHATGAVRLRLDQESDIVYMTSEYKVAGKTAVEHVAHLKPWRCKFSLSKDAFNKNMQTGRSTADVFKEQGLDVIMCDMKAGSLDASIHELRARIGSGRFFIFRSCQQVLEEIRTWRANDKGVIVKVNDDVISALRYALMKLSHATPPGRNQKVDFTIDSPSTAKGTTYAGF